MGQTTVLSCSHGSHLRNWATTLPVMDMCGPTLSKPLRLKTEATYAPCQPHSHLKLLSNFLFFRRSSCISTAAATIPGENPWLPTVANVIASYPPKSLMALNRILHYGSSTTPEHLPMTIYLPIGSPFRPRYKPSWVNDASCKAKAS